MGETTGPLRPGMGELGSAQLGRVVSGPKKLDGGLRQEVTDQEYNLSCTTEVKSKKRIQVLLNLELKRYVSSLLMGIHN